MSDVVSGQDVVAFFQAMTTVTLEPWQEALLLAHYGDEHYSTAQPMITLVDDLDPDFLGWWDQYADLTCSKCERDRMPCGCDDPPFNDAMIWRAGSPVYLHAQWHWAPEPTGERPLYDTARDHYNLGDAPRYLSDGRMRPLLEIIDDDAYGDDSDDWALYVGRLCNRCQSLRQPCTCAGAGLETAAVWRASDPTYQGTP